MKITHYCNSFIVVREGETVLACDPWVGTCNYGGWLSFPITDGGPALLRRTRPTHLYISHLHSDHLHDDTIRELAGTGIVVLIKQFGDGRLLRRIRSLGFDQVIELREWQPLRIGEALEVTIIPADTSTSDDIETAIEYELDTSILIRSIRDSGVFFNNVDSPMTLEQFGRIGAFARKRYGRPIDVACLGIGAASEYPQCFWGVDREAEKARIIESSLTKLALQLNALGNTAYFPAGGTYVVPGKYAALNRFIAQPSLGQQQAVVDRSASCREMFTLEGGGSIERAGDSWVYTPTDETLRFEDREDAIRAHEALEYQYPSVPPPDADELATLFAAASQNYRSKLASSGIRPDWTVTFHLYRDLRLDEHGNRRADIVPLKTFVLDNSPVPPKYELVCHLDGGLFAALLRRECIWNISLSGSIILFERRPNHFVPTIPFSLNYLVA